jgi:hypothetical protein
VALMGLHTFLVACMDLVEMDTSMELMALG